MCALRKEEIFNHSELSKMIGAFVSFSFLVFYSTSGLSGVTMTTGLTPNGVGIPPGKSQPAAEVHVLLTNKRGEYMSSVMCCMALYLEPWTT